MYEKIQEMKELINSIEGDLTKFTEKGNSSAGTRIRIAMQKMKTLAQDVRVEVSNVKNGK